MIQIQPTHLHAKHPQAQRGHYLSTHHALILEIRTIRALCPYPRALHCSWCSGGGGPKGAARRGPGNKPNTSRATEKRSDFTTPRRWKGVSPQNLQPLLFKPRVCCKPGPQTAHRLMLTMGDHTGPGSPLTFFSNSGVFVLENCSSLFLFFLSFPSSPEIYSWKPNGPFDVANCNNVCFSFNG